MPSPSNPNEPDPEQPDFSKLFEQLLGGGDAGMAQAMASMGLDKVDPATMSMLAGQLSAMFQAAPTDGVNLELSADVARKAAAAEGDKVVTEAQRRGNDDAVRVADLWLDNVTNMSAPGAGVRSWSKAEWIDGTMPMWGKLVAPVADGVTHAITQAMRSQLEQLGGAEGLSQMPGLPPGMALPAGMDLSAMFGQMEPMLARMSSSMFGAQIGRAVGTLAGHVLTGTEVGLPLLHDTVVLLPANIEEFAQGLEIDAAQVRLYLAVRETARVRLFADVPWVGPQLVAAVQAYARDISIDTEGIEAKVAGIDPTDPQAMQDALTDSLFSNERSEAQKAALTRMETLLALVEGWVDVVSDRACAPHLPQADALGEAMRRRRATGGPAEQLFSQLVGLELRPRRLRDAANLWAALEDAGGAAARDAAWAHPDLAPTAGDLDDPLGYVERACNTSTDETEADLDAALEAIFAENDAAKARGDIGPESGPSDAGPWPSDRQSDDTPGDDEADGGPNGK
ncbi:zinc-dependent metalloprotease [Gephyromycinifex aptenodytis]|uniref:zinc-dependent metalloprotease n=1 Tax=Gephyromycinifex aptenodytis TaxID=2716227 RepID=UPI0014452263|nr:zinc-dependent metalloprotease [Gephyromycinifex aptenodytis]